MANTALTNRDDSGPLAEENRPFISEGVKVCYGSHITHCTQLPATLSSLTTHIQLGFYTYLILTANLIL